MRQDFYDASGKKTGEDTTGSVMARLKAMEAKIRQLSGAKTASPKPAAKPTPTPKANPMGKKKFHDKKVNPDTGEPAAPGDPTIKYNASGAPAAVGSGPSYHFDGATAGGPAGGPASGHRPLGVSVNMGRQTMPAHHHIAGMQDHKTEMQVGANSAVPLPGLTIVDSHHKE